MKLPVEERMVSLMLRLILVLLLKWQVPSLQVVMNPEMGWMLLFHLQWVERSVNRMRVSSVMIHDHPPTQAMQLHHPSE
jgi:hypothetical protein